MTEAEEILADRRLFSLDEKEWQEFMAAPDAAGLSNRSDLRSHGAFSLLGLGANSLCLFLLWRHREEDANMSSGEC